MLAKPVHRKQFAGFAAILAICFMLFSTTTFPAAAKIGETTTPATQGEAARSATIAEIMANQRLREASGLSTRMNPMVEVDDDVVLPYDPTGPSVSRMGQIPGVSPNTPVIQGGQTVGSNFTGDVWNQNVPPDTQGAVGPTQFLGMNNGKIGTYSKATGTADGVLSATINTFFQTIAPNGGIFDPVARYDRLIQRWIVTAEDAGDAANSVPNFIYIAVSNSATLTNSSTWFYYKFQTALVNPQSALNCFADYPTTAVDANFIIIGTNNFCPDNYAASDIYVILKSSIANGGTMTIGVFRNVGLFTPRGVDSWDVENSTASGYVISVFNSSTIALRRIAYNGSSFTIGSNLTVTVPQFAQPMTLEHLGNAHPGGSNNGKIDGGDTRFMPAVRRNGSLWAAHESKVNNTGAGTSAGDRDGVRWYEFGNIGTTPGLIQAGTIYDSATVNPTSYTYGGVAVTGQGHAAFGFSAISAVAYNSAAFTGRLVGHPAGFTNTPQIYKAGIGPYNAFDQGTDSGMRWGDYSQSTLDPCDDMTVWTIQEFTAIANTAGQADASWGQQIAQLKAPPPPPGNALAITPNSVSKVSSVNVTVNATPTDGEGFYNTPNAGADACRVQLAATATNSVTVNSITYNNANQVVLNLNTSGATSNSTTVTITNPDGQQTTVAIPITTGAARPDTIGIYTNGIWYLRNTNSSGAPDITVSFGGDPNHLPVVGDWNGDGVDTVGVYNTLLGTFSLSNSNTTPNVDYGFTLGNPNDTPFAGKWTVDMNHDGAGVYRNSNGILYEKKDLTTGFSDFFAVFGNPGDFGIAGDWDGNGLDSIGIYRPSGTRWYMTNNGGPSGITFSDIDYLWDIGTAVPVVGDWDGDGTTTAGFFNTSAVFVLHPANATTGTDTIFAFGPTGAKPIAGKWIASSQPSPLNGVIVNGSNNSKPNNSDIIDGRAD